MPWGMSAVTMAPPRPTTITFPSIANMRTTLNEVLYSVYWLDWPVNRLSMKSRNSGWYFSLVKVSIDSWICGSWAITSQRLLVEYVPALEEVLLLVLQEFREDDVGKEVSRPRPPGGKSSQTAARWRATRRVSASPSAPAGLISRWFMG